MVPTLIPAAAATIPDRRQVVAAAGELRPRDGANPRRLVVLPGSAVFAPGLDGFVRRSAGFGAIQASVLGRSDREAVQQHPAADRRHSLGARSPVVDANPSVQHGLADPVRQELEVDLTPKVSPRSGRLEDREHGGIDRRWRPARQPRQLLARTRLRFVEREQESGSVPHGASGDRRSQGDDPLFG
jgi:hypothetical protein